MTQYCYSHNRFIIVRNKPRFRTRHVFNHGRLTCLKMRGHSVNISIIIIIIIIIIINIKKSTPLPAS